MTRPHPLPALLAAAALVLGAVALVGPDTTAAGHSARPVAGPVQPHRASLAGGRPNVVVITMDDMREDDLPSMPHVRRLIGDQGVRFENSFAPYPLCCPSRSSFLTGLYTHNHRVWSHLKAWGFKALRDRETLPLWLQQAGYRTVFLGKYLNGYGSQPAPDGSAANSVRYVPPGWSDWRGAIDQGLPPRHPKNGGTYRFFNTTLNVNGRSFHLEKDRYQTDMLGDQSVRIVQRETGDDTPFFLWANYVAPHHGAPTEPDDPGPVRRIDGQTTRFLTTARPARARGRFDARITRAPGASGEADVSDKPHFIREQPPLNIAERRGLLEVTRQRAEALSVADHQIARTVAALRRAGELDDTLLVFTSDNGYFLGEHRIRQGKILPYEPALAVPLLARGPGIPRGEVRRDPISTVDLAPTILDAAGATTSWPLNGVSMLDVARRGDRGWRRAVLTETGPRGVVAGADDSGPQLKPGLGSADTLRYSQGVRTGRYLYVEHASGEVELYDMRRDPGQLDSVATDPAYAADRLALAGVLDRLRDCRGQDCAADLPRSLQTP